MDPAGNASLAAARYAALAALVTPSVRRYNMPWSSFETSRMVPAKTPVACPTGYTMVRCPATCRLAAAPVLASTCQAAWHGRQVPASTAQRAATGYHLFHCYLSVLISQFHAYLALDYANGIESAAVIWGSAPPSSGAGAAAHARGQGCRACVRWCPCAQLPESQHGARNPRLYDADSGLCPVEHASAFLLLLLLLLLLLPWACVLTC